MKEFPLKNRILLNIPHIKYKYSSQFFLKTLEEELKLDSFVVKHFNHSQEIINLDDIVGTFNSNKKYCFAKNYMPLVGFSENLDFISRWEILSNSISKWLYSENLINLIEYKNKFYVVEGNRRVSVAKFNKIPFIRANIVSYS
jgi:hypothetical protein